MAYTYVEAIGVGFPNVQCHAIGDGSVYSDIVWDAGSPLPSKQSLDDWIASNPQPSGVQLTKYEFRKLFTFDERVACDNCQSNANIPANYKAMLLTMNKDLDLSGAVELSNPDVIAGVQFLEQLSLIGAGRAAMILSNTPHA